MKEKSLVTLDLENKKIVDIVFEKDVLNHASGLGQIKAFIRRKVLNSPIQNFTPMVKNNMIVYTIPLLVDIYPLIKKTEHYDRANSFRCKLSPLPITGKESDITFDEYTRRYSQRKTLTNTPQLK